MPKSLPPYETIVRWTVKDVVDWLKEAGLGEFKDHVTKHNIDGNKLASLSEFDVHNFVGKPKKKIELQNYILSIKKPKNTPSRAWNPPPQKQLSSGSKNGYDSDSGDSIYSWGDEFSDDEGGKKDDTDDDDSDDDENYIEPEAGPKRPPPSTPGHRPPQPVPPTAAPLLPGQIIPTAKSKKNIPKTPVDEYYEDPDKSTQSKPTRRAPPPPPPDSPDIEQEAYLNSDAIEAVRKRIDSVPHEYPPPIPPTDDGYIKYNPNNQDVYTDPDEEANVPASRNERPPLPSIPTSKEKSSKGRKISLPPVPRQQSKKKSDPSSRKMSQPETQPRKLSQPETQPRKLSQPETPARKLSQPDQMDGMSSFEWYHNDLERAIAEDRLKTYNHDGMFLVRKSLKGGNVHPYTLMVFYKAKVFNFPVRKRDSDGKFALGKKDAADDIAFDTVDALIQNYQKVNMILQGAKGQGWTATLSKPLPK